MVMQESERPEVGLFGSLVESLELALPKIFFESQVELTYWTVNFELFSAILIVIN